VKYIPDRFLPDKAIDLMDEAASRLSIEIDSKPEELDAAERRLTQMQIEEQALEKESDEASKERLENLRRDMAAAKEDLAARTAEWQNERGAIEDVQNLKAELDAAQAEEERAIREGDLSRASELRYATIPSLQQRLADAEEQMGDGQESGLLKKEVTEEEIAEVVSAWTGIPVSKMMRGEMEKLVDLEAKLHERVVGQDHAVNVVAGAIRRNRAGLSDPDRPIGSFLFLGPTGVGKTELAKALAEYLFDSERNMVRIDMSEYMEKFSVQRLIGAPPGYVGYDEGGQLTEAVRRRPYSVILLDEMEKAHPDVFNILLQVLDDGRLTDGQGRVVSFKNTIIIMTSNVGSQYIAAANATTEPDEVQRQVNEALRATFKPEFLNRIDDVVVFHALGLSDIEKIVDIQLRDVRERLARERITLELTEAATGMLALEGLDPVYGARPLKRLIQRQVVDNIAGLIIDGRLHEGEKVLVDVGFDGATLTAIPLPQSAEKPTEADTPIDPDVVE
jgi:ATP-dependent Clp protease ATP-binding subunit ClpB